MGGMEIFYWMDMLCFIILLAVTLIVTLTAEVCKKMNT